MSRDGCHSPYFFVCHPSPGPIAPPRDVCLTGVKQNYARRCKIPIDSIIFDFSCMPAVEAVPKQHVDDGGAYITGMFVEGARWDYETGQLAESLPKVGGLAVSCGHQC